VHHTWTGDEEVILQVTFVGPVGVSFVNPAENPEKKVTAVAAALDRALIEPFPKTATEYLNAIINAFCLSWHGLKEA
jgi:hypothetical protein